MNNKFSFYFQKDNLYFGGEVLTICYKANKEEIEKYSLTSENIVLFIKSKKFDKIINNNVEYFNLVSKLFEDEIFIRIQSECLLGTYGDSHCDCEEQKKKFINLLKENDGIYIHMPQEAQGWGLFYKCQELEIQVNGKDTNGKNIGVMTRDEAQKYLLKSKEFKDNRNYELISNILKDLNLENKLFILYTESESKLNQLKKTGLKVIKYLNFINQSLTTENASEYLIKILDGTHKFNKNIIDKISEIIKKRKYNDRTLETLIDIVDKINKNKNFRIDNYTKQILLSTYNEIICGEEREYILKYSSIKKHQNKFSCRVNAMIFKQLLNIYNKNIYDRICFEKIYYFTNKETKDIKKIRTSQVLDIKDEKSEFFKDQIYSVERIIYYDSKVIEEDSTSLSKLRTLFENSDYDYTKRQEMITYISEEELPNINVYLKRIPNNENWILDVYGKKEAIHKFINRLAKQKNHALLSFITNIKLEEDNYSDYNLRFSDIEIAIKEELENFRNLNIKENYGNGN